MKELIAQHASELITGIIAVVIGWFGKSKMSKKVEDAELTKLVQGIYKDMISDTDRMIDQNTQEIAELKKKLQQKDQYWQNKYSILQRENRALKQRISELEKH
ncbi:hypothetical protein HX001_00145 [Empedobacter brevis]|uniref:Uncharacterized protein n=1 Tax=Empedobacter brevis TaxID=247 RepID=A0AAJ1V7J0_9FLAO|nr:hypothetical protein [Empedobacter brevis]MDM1070895.1 hypothetical protein [Empedobacter brevis]